MSSRKRLHHEIQQCNALTLPFRFETPKCSPTHNYYVATCTLWPHQFPLTFKTHEEFETHYLKHHSHRCPDCHKNFPTDHYLGLHIEENHDPLVEAKRARGEKAYRCFQPHCPKTCLNPSKRRLHLIDKHSYPKKYDFSIINTGTDNKPSLLRSESKFSPQPAQSPKLQIQPPNNPKDPPPTTDENTPVAAEAAPPAAKDNHPNNDATRVLQQEEPPADREIEVVMSKISSLAFVPPSVRRSQLKR